MENTMVWMRSKCHDCEYMEQIHDNGKNEVVVRCAKYGDNIEPKAECKRFRERRD